MRECMVSMPYASLSLTFHILQAITLNKIMRLVVHQIWLKLPVSVTGRVSSWPLSIPASLIVHTIASYCFKMQIQSC